MTFERITIDPQRMGGVQCIRDLRVTVSMVLGQLAGGATVEQLLADYPYLERADVLATLESQPQLSMSGRCRSHGQHEIST